MQTASRAKLEMVLDEEMIVAALLHDIGDEIAPLNHSVNLQLAVLKPFVSEKTRWIVEKHGLFQTYYYNHHYGQDRNLRDKYVGHPHYVKIQLIFAINGIKLHLILTTKQCHLKNLFLW